MLSMGAGAVYILFFAPEEKVSISSDPFSKLLPFSDSKEGAAIPSASKKKQDLTDVQSKSISIHGLNGFVEVRDFTKDVGVASTTEGDAFYLVYPAEGAFSYKDLDYEIDYIPEEQRIFVLIYKEPIGDIRRRMAIDLANRLGLSASNLCTLDILVIAPRWVNDYYADKNFGFPGCPNGIKFAGD